ncbi:MAG TPA: alcohol dehydrogenase catalytic domain-containing protein, partial [Candidatus Limnocylindrales bacterium]|nr:alcohol dehydrogenase catalytic domain-containing protein [Candidatus Limnocylindrales bacterium]
MSSTDDAPTTVRAAVLQRPGVATRIEVLDLRPPGPGEVRVRMASAGVCHSDLHVRDGEWEREGPIVMGHEGSAIVEELGAGVAERFPGLRPGGLVALSWLIPCGACRACRSGRVWSCSASPSYTHRMPDGRAALARPGTPPDDVLTYCAIGTFADRQNVPAAAAIPMPDGTPPDVAALIGCCVTTGVGAALKTAAVQPGSSVAVIGLGGVGLSIVMGAVVAGASRIVAVDRVAAKLELARSLGATDTIQVDDRAATLAAIRDLTDGGPDTCFE